MSDPMAGQASDRDDRRNANAEPAGSTRMWETVAAPGRVEELLSWVLGVTPVSAAVYRAEDPDGRTRVVVVDPTGGDPGAPPVGLVARPPHSWSFQPVPRPGGEGLR